MYGPAFTFLGIPACDLDDPKSYQGADVIIVGAPIESGTSHRSGAKFGPQAIRGGDYLSHDGSRPHLGHLDMKHNQRTLIVLNNNNFCPLPHILV